MQTCEATHTVLDARDLHETLDCSKPSAPIHARNRRAPGKNETRCPPRERREITPRPEPTEQDTPVHDFLLLTCRPDLMTPHAL